MLTVLMDQILRAEMNYGPCTLGRTVSHGSQLQAITHLPCEERANKRQASELGYARPHCQHAFVDDSNEGFSTDAFEILHSLTFTRTALSSGRNN